MVTACRACFEDTSATPMLAAISAKVLVHLELLGTPDARGDTGNPATNRVRRRESPSPPPLPARNSEEPTIASEQPLRPQSCGACWRRARPPPWRQPRCCTTSVTRLALYARAFIRSTGRRSSRRRASPRGSSRWSHTIPPRSRRPSCGAWRPDRDVTRSFDPGACCCTGGVETSTDPNEPTAHREVL